MHNPIRLDPLRWPSFVKHERLLHPHILGPTVDCLVCACGFPITRHGCSVWPNPIWVLSVSWAKEIPFIFSKLCFLCIYTKHNQQHKLQYPKKMLIKMVTLLLISIPTRQFPRIKLVDINFWDYGSRAWPRRGLVFEVMDNQFLISWVESKTRWEFRAGFGFHALVVNKVKKW